MQAESFRLPTWPWVGLFGGLSLPFIAARWFYYGLVATIPSLIIAALFVVLVFWSSRLSMGPGGLRLYRVNRMRWNEARRARLKTLVGLEYVQVERVRGMSWWIPLYFVGSRDLRAALIEHSPAGNPIRECLAPDKRLQPTRTAQPNDQREPARFGPRGSSPRR
jgi:hypothetical protein